MEKLSPSETDVLEALRSGDLRFKGLKGKVRTGKERYISERGLANAVKTLQTLGLIQRLPSREYHIRPTGEDYLIRRKLTQSMENEPVHYSKEIIFKVDSEPLYQNPENAEIHFSQFENYPLPIPVQASYFGSEELKFMIGRAMWHHVEHDRADKEELPGVILEGNARPLMPYLIEMIFDKCVNFIRLHEDGFLKGKPKLDIFNILDFNWGLTIQLEGKRLLDEVKRDPSSPLRREVEERLVGFLLLCLLYINMPGCEHVIPSMVRGGLLNRKEGEEIQELYEKIHGRILGRRRREVTRMKFAREREESKARRLYLIKILEHLKRGNGLYVAKTGVHGIEGTGLTEDDVFREIVKAIQKGPREP